MESAKNEDFRCFCNQNIQPNDVNTKKRHLMGNRCLESLSMTDTAEDVSNFKTKHSEEKVGIGLQSSKRDCPMAVDDPCDQFPDREKQQDNSIMNSISNFTADLKEKLLRLSFPAIEKASSSVEGRNFGEPNSNMSQSNCDNAGYDLTVNHSLFSAKSKQKNDRTEQDKLSCLCGKANPTYADKAKVSKRCNKKCDSSTLQVERFKRFYHVFTKEELSELLQNVRRLKILSQCYDHGNWVLKAERIDAPE